MATTVFSMTSIVMFARYRTEKIRFLCFRIVFFGVVDPDQYFLDLPDPDLP